MKYFFLLLFVYIVCFGFSCHFTCSYILYPFLLMFPVTEMAELVGIPEAEMRSMAAFYRKRYASLLHTILGTYVILLIWNVYLLHTLETCSVELSFFTTAIMVALGAYYAYKAACFRKSCQHSSLL